MVTRSLFPGHLAALAVFLIVGLAGCAPHDDEVCASYGLPPGTRGFGQCMMQRQQSRMQAAQMFMGVMQQQQQNQQFQYQQQMQAIQNARPVNTNTSCYRTGNYLNCNSTSN